MTELRDDELDLLREARRQFTPAPDVVSRVAAAVALSIAPPAATEQLASGLERSTHSLPGAKITSFGHGLLTVSGKTVLLSALALAGAVGTTSVWLREPTSQRLALPSASVPPMAPPPLTTVTPEPSQSVEPPSAPVAPVPALERSVEAVPRPARPRTRDANQSATAPTRLPFDDELTAVHAADSALGEGNPARALSILNALGPTENGNLGEERSALRLLARCALTGAERAELVEQFLARYPHSVYSARVRAACGQ